MSFPRKSDVAKHLARKPGPASKLRHEIISKQEVPDTDLQMLADELSSAVDCGQNSAKQGGHK